MNNIRRAVSYIKPYKTSFSLSIFFNLLYAFFNVLALSSMMPVLQILFDEQSKPITKLPVYSGNLLDLKNYFSEFLGYYIQQIKATDGPVTILMYSCIIFIILFFLRNIFNYLSEFCLIDMRTGITNTLRQQLYNKILALPVAYFTEKRKGDMMTVISSDVNEVEGTILGSIIELIRSPIMIIVFLIALFTYSFQLTIFALIVFPIMGTIISIIGKSLKKNSHKAQNELGKIFSYVDESLTAAKIIKIFGAEGLVRNRFNETLERFKYYSKKIMKRRALASPTSEFLGSITIALIVYFGGRLTLMGQGLTGSEFIVYIGLFYTLLDPIKRFSKALSDIQKGEVSADRIFKILDTDLRIKEIENPIVLNSIEKGVEFKNVTFSYNGKQNVIKDFNLFIPKGKTVALVGHSGSGKSTITNLITRFYDVEEGEILIDGINIKDLDLKKYRKLIGLVTQNSILFNDTVYDNILIGKQDATKEEVIKAAETSNSYEFIEKNPEGFDLEVGEGGAKLSGGQQQRIAIARAVLKNPPLMILDEATASLDTISERLVQDALEKMMFNRTSLVIAHRLSTIQKADIIVVMDKGRIIEQGTHKELLENSGTYSKLIEMQSVTG